jgi:hypothetical protein
MNAVPPGDPLERIRSLRLGKSSEVLEVDSSAAVASAVLALATQARREIVLTSRHLDPRLYDNAEFAHALRDFALQHRNARLRALVTDSRPAVRSSHRLVGLAQRLSTYVEIRIPSREFSDFNSAYLVADSIGFVYRPLSDRYEGTVDFNNRGEATRLVREFEEIWASSAPDPGMRRLNL